MKTKKAVESVLNRDLRARSSDKWLIINVLREMGFRVYIDYSELHNMPSFESITRCRRYLQNQGKYVSEEEIKKSRNEKAEVIKTNLSVWY